MDQNRSDYQSLNLLSDLELDIIRTMELLESKFESMMIQFVGPNCLSLNNRLLGYWEANKIYKFLKIVKSHKIVKKISFCLNFFL